MSASISSKAKKSSSSNDEGNQGPQKFYPRYGLEAQRAVLLVLPAESEFLATHKDYILDTRDGSGNFKYPHRFPLFPDMSQLDPSMVKSFNLTVGRAQNCQICLHDLLISKLHACISYYEGYGYCLRDIGR